MTRQQTLPLPHREALGADDFLVTASNREAAAWLDKWPDWPAHCFILYGPAGSGKTHLAQMWQARSQAQAMTVAELTSQDAGSLTGNNHPLLIDDASNIAGNPDAEEALFHLYNSLREKKNFLLLTSAQPPAQWNIQLADLRSRLLAAPCAAIAAPDDELVSAMLIKQFRDRQITLGMDVVDYLLPRIERTPAAIRDLVNALDKASLAEGRRITVALARRFLEDQGFLLS
ncbi:MAG: DnaA/Hda family protein [Alphaproteobacteria bacterium]|nr:DnaA/Hda family protein [Alphaproteobacteria bacterium]